MTNRAHVLLWTDNTTAYLDAIEAAGLADRVAVETLPRKEKPSADQLAHTEALLAYGRAARPAAVDAQAALGAGADRGRRGLAGAAGSAADLDAHLRARHARESMPENILGALFYIAKPYAAAVENQKHGKWVHTRRAAADRQDARHPRPGRGRSGRCAHRRGARHAGDRHQARPGADRECRRGAAARAHRRGAGAVRLRAAAAARHAGDRQLHQRRAPGEDEARPRGCSTSAAAI